MLRYIIIHPTVQTPLDDDCNMPGVCSKFVNSRKPTSLPSDIILDIFKCLARKQITKAARAGATFARPLLAHGARLPLREISIGCNHPDSGVAVHGEDFITVISTESFEERLQNIKKNVYISRFYICSPLAAPDGIILHLRQAQFDALITYVLRPLRHLLAKADVEVSQTPTDEQMLSLFMYNFSEARTFRHIPDIPNHVAISVWRDAYFGYGKNVYQLEVSSIDISLQALQALLDFPAKEMVRLVVHQPDIELGMKLSNFASNIQRRSFHLPATHPGFQIVVMSSMENWLGHDDEWLLDDFVECDVIVRRSKLKISLMCSYDRCVYTVENIGGRSLKYA